MSLDPKVISDLKAKNPDADLTVIRLGESTFVIRPLNEAEFQRVVDMVNDDKKKSHAPKVAAQIALVYPAVEERDHIFKRRPGYLIKLGEKVFDEAGLNAEIESEKLLGPSRGPAGGRTFSRRRRPFTPSFSEGPGVSPRSARSCSPSSSRTSAAARARPPRAGVPAFAGPPCSP
jgi:hypothetical protein